MSCGNDSRHYWGVHGASCCGRLRWRLVVVLGGVMWLTLHDRRNRGEVCPEVQSGLKAPVPGPLNSIVAADSVQRGGAPGACHRLITVRVGHHVDMGTEACPYQLSLDVLAHRVGLSGCRARENL